MLWHVLKKMHIYEGYDRFTYFELPFKYQTRLTRMSGGESMNIIWQC